MLSVRLLLSVMCSSAGFAGLAGEVSWHVTVSLFLVYVGVILYASATSEPRHA